MLGGNKSHWLTKVGMTSCQQKKDLIAANDKKRSLTAWTAASVQTSLDYYFGGSQPNNKSKKQKHVSSFSSSSLDDPKRYISTVRNILSSKSSSAFGTCPICNNTNIPIHRLAAHASQCNGNEQKQQQRKVHSNTNIEDNPSIWLHHPSRTDIINEVDHSIARTTTLINSFASLDDPTIEDEEEDEESVTIKTIPTLPYTEPVPGLYVFENFVTVFEEEQILLQLDSNNSSNDIDTHNTIHNKDEKTTTTTSSSIKNLWKAATFNGKHYGQRWGVHCDLRTRQVLPEERSLPKFYSDFILPKLQNLRSGSCPSKISTILKGYEPNEMNAIDYRKSLGHSLSAHVDDRHLSKEVILNMSLAGDCYMKFTPVEKPNASLSSSLSKQNVATRVLLKRRCLQIMTGPTRYQYTHGIDHNDLMNERRVSLTIRESPITTEKLKKPMATISSFISTTRSREIAHEVATPNQNLPVLSNVVVTTKPYSLTSLSWIKPVFVEPICTPSPMVSIGEAIVNQVSPDVPPGLFIFPNFITEQQEEELLHQLDKTENIPQWSTEHHTGIHREKRWGVDHDLWSRKVREPIHVIPSWIESMIIHRLQLLRLQSEHNDRTKKENDIDGNFVATMQSFDPNDVNAIEYKRDNGHSLGAHIDDRQKHTEPIANLSLAGNCYMEYTLDPIKKKTSRNGKSKGVKPAKTNCTDASENVLKDIYRVFLPRRTLQILTGRARYDYRHGIHNADLSSERRISITLRESRS